MADYSIDFKKVDAAFQKLADSKDGNAALDGLAKALDNVGAQSGQKLNTHELKYLLTNLVEQKQAPGAQGPGFLTPTTGVARVSARVQSGFLIKTAVPAS